jgi:hypothetical protein
VALRGMDSQRPPKAARIVQPQAKLILAACVAAG